ncbi:polyphosphate kinase 1 [uncultured Ilyobacter sp.]|uniref:polyphosphate kinase 1 n=1 Tax=uncultured Ilyobacter sp. TaxID=544433 RepID=UPI002AA71DF9|nr:polyphosphate kinase 1 [uncultured Ilyobacter sp.]
MGNNYEYNHFYNRELSWLEFNQRVLQETSDSINPLLERLKFLAITSSNLDEFFMVRVAGLIAQYEEGVIKKDISGLTPEEQLKAINKRVKTFVQAQYISYKEILSILNKKNHLKIKKYSQLDKKQKNYADEFYNETLFPILTPMGIDASRPFPHILTGSLNIVVHLKNGEEKHMSIVQVPRVVNRIIELPCNSGREFILIEELIKSNLQNLFPGCNILDTGFFRITRNADMIIDEDEADDLLIEIEKELQKRKWGEPVRMEYDKDISETSLEFLTKNLKIQFSNLYEVDGPIDLTFIFELMGHGGFYDIKYEKYTPKRYAKLEKEAIYETLKKEDMILSHPYDSFDHISDLIEAAAKDKNVLAIKQTLYRVSGDSPIISSLIKAAKSNKQVTVMVELKARFDEERNIKWAKELEKSGCHVIYGIKGLKTHAKCLLIVRRESSGIKRYLHLGTGNYNNSTAKLYTDLSLLTTNEELCADVSNLFNILTGFSQNSKWKRLITAPKDMRDEFYRLIDREIQHGNKGKKAKIIVKVNSLVDEKIIRKLYDASRAGVEVVLIVRGACCLKTGIKGISENIKVFSLVGRFLEHTRVYHFENNGDPELYLSSADWMGRNLDRRIETLFPVIKSGPYKKVMETIDSILRDNVKLRQLDENGTYFKVKNDKKNFSSQEYLFGKKQ